MGLHMNKLLPIETLQIDIPNSPPIPTKNINLIEGVLVNAPGKTDSQNLTGSILEMFSTYGNNKSIILTETQWDHINKALKNHVWPFYSKAIMNFVNQFEKLEECDPNKPITSGE